MPAKQDRIRVDIWSSLRPIIEAEMNDSGLSAQEVVNVALVDYFGLSPKGRSKNNNNAKTIAQVPKESNESLTDDYI